MEDNFNSFLQRNNVDDLLKCKWGWTAIMRAMEEAQARGGEGVLVHAYFSIFIMEYFKKEYETRSPEEQRVILNYLNSVLKNFTPFLDMDMTVRGDVVERAKFKKNPLYDIDSLEDGLTPLPDKEEPKPSVEETMQKMNPINNDILNQEKQQIMESKHLGEEQKTQMVQELEEEFGLEL